MSESEKMDRDLEQESDEADRFDPETGKPLTEEEREPDRFDPETGKPLTDEDVEPDRFDPETGKPLTDNGVEEPDRFDPETGKPLTNQGSQSKMPKLAKPVMIGVLAAAALGILTVTVISAGLFKSSKDIVADALSEIVLTADEGFLEDEFGIRDLRELAESGAVHMGAEIKLNDTESLGIPGSIGASVGFSRDPGKNTVMINSTAEIADMELGSFVLYMDDQTLAAAAPDLLDQVVTINYGDPEFGKKMERSYLGEESRIEAEDMEYVASFVKELNQQLVGKKKTFNLNEIYERYKETTKAVDTLKDAMEIETLDKKEFSIDGKKKNCRGYDIKISNRAIAEFAKSAGKFITTDEGLKENELAYVCDLLTIARMADGWHYNAARDWAEDTMSEFMDLLTEGNDELEDFIRDNLGDIHMVLYVDSKGNAVSLAMDTVVDIYDEVEVEAEFTFKSGAVPAKNMEGTVRFTQESTYRNDLKCTFEKSEAETKDRWTSDVAMRFSTEYTTIRLSSKTEYSKSDGSFDITMKGDNMVDPIQVSIEGKISEHKKGKSLKAELESFEIRGGFIQFGSELEGSIFIEPLSGGITMPEGKVFDIAEAEEADWDELAEDLSARMDELFSLYY